jgi:predicted ATPase with chaperone activity
MEDKVVTISRAKGSLTFSANFQLIVAVCSANANLNMLNQSTRDG